MQGQPVNLLDVWHGIDTNLFTIVPNSAGVEHLFSMLGIVQTKHRNHLGVEKARKIVLVKANINRIYGSGHQEQSCKFNTDYDVSDSVAGGAHDAPAGDASLLSSAPPVDADTAGRAEVLINSDAISFHAVAAELFELIAEDIADATAANHGEDPLDSPHSQNSTPPSASVPVPRGDASYELKWLFEFLSPLSPEAVAPATTAPAVFPANSARPTESRVRSANPLTSFWRCSTNNCGKELVTYEPDFQLPLPTSPGSL